MKGYLLLEDGLIFEGTLFGCETETVGEVVFNTGMTGYEEIITDPSYYGQIVILTYPLIGNYGISHEDEQSRGPKIKGLVCREFVEDYSNWRGKDNLSDYLNNNKIVGIQGIDTRALVKHIRDKGTMIGKIVSETLYDVNKADVFEGLEEGVDILKAVTTPDAYDLGKGDLKVAVLDFGIKRNILDSLVLRNLNVRVFPAFTSVENIMAYAPDGIFLSNGPGNPEDYVEVIENVKTLLDLKPVFGICLGHQLISLALGAKTEKLKFGHRGSNHPVKDLVNDKIVITSQNHGYVVVDESLKDKPVTVTHLNLNDRSIEGLKHNELPIFSVQYHPEASPGPGDSSYLFDEFIRMMKEAE
ncbi:glutamine-hydrolyzing carbamoyl-phosphate synthase small subunit [Fusibacter paucivorans]|uniref:Carbamoyl phosphate synthase small chain n=1 Tax=Fusibacter paucivorans TaxID=76009 RepID=A0ABS5PN16_9FIRM|nr:glutamine-hydrolyzing carbamoyl-phosphate synthase small subunit [Fusibacter paucivorans]MBS7526458.1 glutamine-hydrolyzing carbamoyl-phosphate synthase small subunit [Fusibacter paucivorans]